MGDVVDGRDSQAVLVAQAADNAEEMDAVTAVADRAVARLDIRALIRDGVTSDQLVRAVLMAGVASSASRIEQQAELAGTQVRQSAAALRRADPKTLKAVKDVDIAEERSRRKAPK